MPRNSLDKTDFSDMNTGSITALVPAYQSAKFIQKTLNSLSGQTRNDFKVVISVRLEDGHAIVVAVFRPSGLAGIALGIVASLIIDMKDAQTALRYVRFKTSGLPILNEEVFVGREIEVYSVDFGIRLELLQRISAGR